MYSERVPVFTFLFGYIWEKYCKNIPKTQGMCLYFFSWLHVVF